MKIHHSRVGLGVMGALVTLTAMSTTPQPASASGGTSSGGGNGYSNRGNPWFLENTRRVDYCIDMDEQAMGISLDRAADIVRGSLEYWKNSFALSAYKEYEPGEIVPFGQVRIATQDFRQVPCSSELLLRFQLGRLATPEQARLIGPDHDLIGIAMRTAYDNVNMAGSGFIFITPQTGPLKTRAAGFSSEAWSACDGCGLELALRHELGHVFGVDHVGDDEMDWNIMANHFLAEFTSEEWVRELKKPKLREYIRARFGLPFFSFDLTRLVVNEPNRGDAARLFGELDENVWLQVRQMPRQDREPFAEYRIESFVPGSGAEPVLLARSCDSANRSQVGYGRSASILIYLPKQQRVFTRLPTEPGRKLPQQLLEPSHRSDYGLETNDVMCTQHPAATVERFGMHLRAGRSGGSVSVIMGEDLKADFLKEFPGGRYGYLMPHKRKRSTGSQPGKEAPKQPTTPPKKEPSPFPWPQP